MIRNSNHMVLPFIAKCGGGSCFHHALLPHGLSSHFWLLSVDADEPITAQAAVAALVTLQLESTSRVVEVFVARRLESTRKSLLDEHRAMFNQVRLLPQFVEDLPAPILALAGCRVVASPVKPIDPVHIGHVLKSDFLSDWKAGPFRQQ